MVGTGLFSELLLRERVELLLLLLGQRRLVVEETESSALVQVVNVVGLRNELLRSELLGSELLRSELLRSKLLRGEIALRCRGGWSPDTGEIGAVVVELLRRSLLGSELRVELLRKLLGSELLVELLRRNLLGSELLLVELLRRSLLGRELLLLVELVELLRSKLLIREGVEGLRSGSCWLRSSHGKGSNGFGKMASFGAETFGFPGGVFDSFDLTVVIQVTVFTLDVAVHIAGLYLERTVGGFETVRVRAIVVDLVDLFQNGNNRSCWCSCGCCCCSC